MIGKFVRFFILYVGIYIVLDIMFRLGFVVLAPMLGVGWIITLPIVFCALFFNEIYDYIFEPIMNFIYMVYVWLVGEEDDDDE